MLSPQSGSISSEVSAVTTAITANMSPRFSAGVLTDVPVGVLGFAATVHRY